MFLPGLPHRSSGLLSPPLGLFSPRTLQGTPPSLRLAPHRAQRPNVKSARPWLERMHRWVRKKDGKGKNPGEPCPVKEWGRGADRVGCAMALSGQAARRRQCLQHRSWLGREWRKTVWAREPQGCQHPPGHALPCPSILPLTSSQNHCTRSPGGGKVRKGILTSHSVGGCCAVKFRAKISYGDYLGASIILALVYLSISSWLYCGS